MARSYGYAFNGGNYSDEQRKTWDIFGPQYQETINKVYLEAASEKKAITMMEIGKMR